MATLAAGRQAQSVLARRSPGARTLSAAAAIGLLTLTGCNQIDPLKRPYMWQASGANEQNLAAMAVNPADLVHGRDTSQRRVIVESDGASFDFGPATSCHC